MIVKCWRVYCLTPFPDAALMWSHYSNHHRGICLEFDAGEAIIGGALQVQYGGALPSVDMLSISPESVGSIFISKSPDWSYEKEYRILARDCEAPDSPLGLTITRDDFLALPRGALTAIVAGCRSEINQINALVAEYAPGLPVKRAVQVPDRYSLSILE